jgi:hypothetical protein
MWELQILELLIAFFLFLPLIRPFFKKLWTLDGLTILPLFALGTGIGIFPAYGIRPECLPLVLFAVFLNILNLPALGAVFRRLKNDDFRDRGFISTGFLGTLLIAFTALAICYAPRDMGLADSGTSSITLRDEGRGVDLFLRAYAPEIPPGEGVAKRRPLILLAPPAMGSLLTVDRLCEELSRRGFATLVYSRKGVDAPAIRLDGKKQLLSPPDVLRLLRAMLQGTRWEGANAIGRGLEEERKQDLAFLLASLQSREGLRRILPEDSTDRNVIFIVGYGAGGAAAAALASEEDFARRNPAVWGIIGLECPILSALGQGPAQGPAAARGTLTGMGSFWAAFDAKITALTPRRIRGLDWIPKPEVPILFILSDRALSHSWRREQRYLSIMETYRRSAVPAALVMVPGAGPLDYSGVPEKYPLLSKLFPGEAEPLWAAEDYPGGTASLIANFFAALTEGGVVPKTPLESAIHVDVNRAWNFGAAECILGL